MTHSWHQRYRQTYLEQLRRNSPGFYAASGGDSIIINYPKVATANGKNMFIIKFLTYSGFMADRTNSTGIPIKGFIPKYNLLTETVVNIPTLKGWRKQNSRNGRGDVTAIIHGIYCLFETKTPRDKLSDDQKSFHADVIKSGGQAVVVGPIEDFLTWFDKFIAERNKINEWLAR